MSSP
ncbi:hypothetical protein RDI58_003869 [Solanum bulbocastanum]|jgi:predicted kinase